MEPVSQRSREATNPVVPQRELLKLHFKQLKGSKIGKSIPPRHQPHFKYPGATRSSWALIKQPGEDASILTARSAG